MARRPDIRRSREAAAAVGLTALLLMAGCSGGEPSGSVAGSASAEASGAPSASAATGVSVVLPDAGVLPRSVAYGIAIWTVKDAAITNQDPGSYAAGVEGAQALATSLILDFDLRNDNIAVGILADNVRMLLSVPNAAVVTGVNVRQVGVGPQSTAAGRYAFEVPAGTTFDGLVLSIADPGREASVDLPLSGPAPEVEEDVSVDLDVSTAIPIPGVAMTWTLSEQITGREWPLPLGFVGGTLPGDARAATGQVWLGIRARVQVGTCSCPGGILDQSGEVRLMIDGVPYTAAARATTLQIMNAQQVADVMLVFAIPAGSTDATLQIGPLATPSQQSTVALDLTTQPGG